MKFSLFSITAILASFVAANPILAPRAPSRPFRLQGNVGSRGSYRELAILPVTQRNGADYYQFGWYGTGSEQIELFFTDDETMPGPVFDVRQDGYEMYVSRSPLPAPHSPGITPLTLLQGAASGPGSEWARLL